MDTLNKILLGFILLKVIELGNPDNYRIEFLISGMLIIGFAMLVDWVDSKIK